MKMRKLWALLLAVCMVFGMLAGCSDTEETASTQPSETTSTEPSTEPSEEPTEEPITWENQIIIGDTTEPSGDVSYKWSSNGADSETRDFLWGYGTVELTNDTAEYVINETAVKSYEIVENDDGSKTVTYVINDGLTWSNGDPITAKDYLRGLMLFSSPLSLELGCYGTEGYYEVGYTEFNEGSTPYFAGLRLISDTSFSVSVDASCFPDFFEMRYFSFSPEHKNWLPENFDIADSEEGCCFTKDGETVTMDASLSDEVSETINAWRYNPTAFCGPYTLESYDTAGMAYTLKKNPTFKGNYEGQVPSIETIIYKGVKQETMMDQLRTGEVTFIKAAAEGESITTGLSMFDEGIVNYTTFDRNGYGFFGFKCSAGPAQFKEVRHACAYLLDRNEFCRAFTSGFGSVVHGPYGSGMWMTKDGADQLEEALNPYNYNVQAAIDELVAGGWTLNAEGGEYTDGLRYKEVTAEEAGEYPGCVTLSDGRILMPLHLNWASSENNSVSDLLKTMLAEGTGTAEAGMEIEQTVMTFNEMYGEHYMNKEEQYYCCFNLASNFSTPAYDQRLATQYGSSSNVNNINDPELNQLAVDMLLVEPGDNETFLELWVDFIDEWNDYLPAVPLYSNQYYDFYTPHLMNYSVSSGYIGVQALNYAYIEGYEPAN